MRVVDMGTGVNSQIIATSTYWRFEFFTGLLLLALSLPLNYTLAKQMGVVGPAIAILIALAIYNGIRYLFLLRKFNMQPFTLKSFYTIIIALAGYLVCRHLFPHQGLIWIFLRSAVFIAIYLGGIIYFRLSPDLMPLYENLKNRLGFKKK